MSDFLPKGFDETVFYPPLFCLPFFILQQPIPSHLASFPDTHLAFSWKSPPIRPLYNVSVYEVLRPLFHPAFFLRNFMLLDFPQCPVELRKKPSRLHSSCSHRTCHGSLFFFCHDLHTTRTPPCNPHQLRISCFTAFPPDDPPTSRE